MVFLLLSFRMCRKEWNEKTFFFVLVCNPLKHATRISHEVALFVCYARPNTDLFAYLCVSRALETQISAASIAKIVKFGVRARSIFGMRG